MFGRSTLARLIAATLVSIACKPPESPPTCTLYTSDAYSFARSLARDVGPRLAGSDGDAKAVVWAQKTLASFGVSARAEAVTVPVWRRGAERAELVVSGLTQNGKKSPLAVTALGWSYGTPASGLSAEVVEFASLEALAKAQAGALAGKIAFCNVRTERSSQGAGYGKTVAVRGQCPLEAEKRGAIAALVRSVGTDDGDQPHTGSMRIAGAKIPAAALSAVAAEALHVALLQDPVHTTVSLTLETERLPEARSANVVAEIMGTKRKDEIVLIGAHLDSWDLGEGALDDGAGVGIALAVAKIFAAQPGERTLRVVLFAAEENSLAGAKAYAAKHAHETHVAALELDAGTGPVYELRVRTGAPLALPRISGVRNSSEPAEGGADLSPLRALGVPMLDARQDMTHYFDVHHTREDTTNKLNDGDLAQAARVVGELLRFATSANVPFVNVPEAERDRPGH